MAKTALIERKAFARTAADNASLVAGKWLVSLFLKGDIAATTAAVEKAQELLNVVKQEGTGQGKRFSKARSHNPDDNIHALADQVLNGNVPRIE